MMMYSTEMVMAIHRARLAEAQRMRVGRRRSRKTPVEIATAVALRPAAAR